MQECRPLADACLLQSPKSKKPSKRDLPGFCASAERPPDRPDQITLEAGTQEQLTAVVGVVVAELTAVAQAHGGIAADRHFNPQIDHCSVLGNGCTGYAKRGTTSLHKRHAAVRIDVTRGMAPAQAGKNVCRILTHIKRRLATQTQRERGDRVLLAVALQRRRTTRFCKALGLLVQP